MIDNIILFILIIVLILYYKEKTKDLHFLNKIYKQKFKFNKFKYKYYNFLSNLIVNPRSNIKIINIFHRFYIKSNDVFLDIGSGDGFNLLYMNKFHKFKKIIGVEIDKNIFELSVKNISLIRNHKIKLVNNDILNYIIPSNVTYIYLFNPFAKYYFKSKISIEELNKYKLLINNIKNSYLLKYRKITIVFANITPINDSEKKILKLFTNNFKTSEINNIKFSMFESVDIGIFTIF